MSSSPAQVGMEEVVGEPWSRLRRSSRSQAGVSRALGELGVEDASLPHAASFTRAVAVLWQELFLLPPAVCSLATVLLSPWEEGHHSHVSQDVLGSPRAWLIGGTKDQHSSHVFLCCHSQEGSHPGGSSSGVAPGRACLTQVQGRRIRGFVFRLPWVHLCPLCLQETRTW